MFVALVTDLIKNDSQSVPVRFFSSLGAHDVSVGAHTDSTVAKALFDERYLDAQRSAGLNAMRIQEGRAARANIDCAQSQRLRTRLASDAAYGE